MHEMAITHSLLDLVLDHASRAGAHRVTDVRVAIGELSNVVGGAMRLYWDILNAGTAAAGSHLHFRTIAAQFECRDCATRFMPQRRGFQCTTCSGTRVRIVAGEDLQLEAIDVETAPARTRKPTPTRKETP